MRIPLLGSLAKFGPQFRFGVGNSDHQCEALDPATPDIWDRWEERRGLVPRGRATEFQERYAQDFALAQGLGVQLFRFSVSWARVEPAPGQFDAEALAHYRRMVDAITAAGMTPMVTLHHFVWPLHVEERGGMTAPDFPAWFAAYADKVAEALGAQAIDWITFNEPNLLVFGYFRPWWQREFSFPPGLPLDMGMPGQFASVAALMRNLFLAHKEARARIRAHIPDARVGSNPSVLGLPGWIRALIDRRLMRAQSLDQLVRSQRAGRRRRFNARQTAAVIAAFTITKERTDKIDFTSPYLTAGLAALTPAQNPVIDPADLTGAIGVIAGSTAQDMAHRLTPKAQPHPYPDHDAMRQALADGQVDSVLADDVLLIGWQQAFPGRYKLLDRRLTRESYGIGTVRGSGLLDALEAALADFRRSGALDAAIGRHLPGYPLNDPSAGADRSTLSDIASADAAEHQYDPAYWRGQAAEILQGRPVRIAVSSNTPGLGLRDPATGAWEGLEVDIARHVAHFLTGDETRLELMAVAVRERMSLLGGVLAWWQRVVEPIAMLSAVICTSWWHLGMAGRLPEFLCPAECAGEQDFVGFDYYWGIGGFGLSRIKGLIKALSTGDFSNAPIWVGGLGAALRYHHKLFPGAPIYVVENGSVALVSGKVDRAAYLRDHLAEAQRAIARGIKLDTFVVWSITTNREWNARHINGSDFGLYTIDLDGDPDLKRIESSAVAELRRIVEARTTAT